MDSGNQKLTALAWIQSVFYTTTGLWPLIEIHSFMWVTGPKVDVWLVRTVGALLAWTGLLLGRAARMKRVTADLLFLAVGQAAILALVDLIAVGVRRISRIYLLDAAAELVLIALWIWGIRDARKAGLAKSDV